MGMISLYIHIPHILHILSTQSSQTNHTRRFPCSLLVSIFLAIPYIPCRFLSGVPTHRSRILFSPRPFHVVRFSSWARCCELPFALIGLSAYRLIGPAVSSRRACRLAERGVSVSRLVVSGRWSYRRFCSSLRCVVPLGSAPFLSARFLVPSFSSRPSSRQGVAVLTVRSFRRPVRRPVVRFGFCVSSVRLVRASRRGVSFSHRIRCVIRRRSSRWGIFFVLS